MPKIVSIKPAIGATDVSPDLKKILLPGVGLLPDSPLRLATKADDTNAQMGAQMLRKGPLLGPALLQSLHHEKGRGVSQYPELVRFKKCT